MSKMLTIPEAARETGVSEKIIRTAITEEELPAEKVGPMWVIDPEDLAAWAEDNLGDEEEGQESQAEEE